MRHRPTGLQILLLGQSGQGSNFSSVSNAVVKMPDHWVICQLKMTSILIDINSETDVDCRKCYQFTVENRGTCVNLSSDLYTAEQRASRDRSKWTLVQGVLAPLQFVVFLISLALIVRYLWTGQGEFVATVSILIKTMFLMVIMLTGAIWEREVFGQYLFAKPFFWEDVVSLFVIASHVSYVLALFYGVLETSGLMWLALGAYLLYVINAAQFLIKFRLARLSKPKDDTPPVEAQHPDLQMLAEHRGG